jgi:hypothetical protein
MQRDLLTTDQGDVFQKEPIIRLRSRSGVAAPRHSCGKIGGQR